jgi:heat shock protein HslJ
LLSACNTKKEKQITLWVNSFQNDCEGVGKMKCLQIAESDTFPKQWKLWHAEIQDFKHEQGYIFRLLVEKIKPIEENQPMDKTLIQYKLVEIIEKYPDPASRLHDIWALQDTIPDNIIHPYIKLNLSTKRIMGIDGCNNFHGSISKVDGEFLEFGTIATTRKICLDMTIPDIITSKLSLVRKYAFVKNELVLTNDLGEKLLIFKKVD